MLFLALFVCLFVGFVFRYLFLELLIFSDHLWFHFKLNLLCFLIKVWLHLTLRTNYMSPDLCAGHMSSGLYTYYT
jgi:hypothetical protein